MTNTYRTGSAELNTFLKSISKDVTVRVSPTKTVNARIWTRDANFIISYDDYWLEAQTVAGEVSLRMGPEQPMSSLPHALAVLADIGGEPWQ